MYMYMYSYAGEIREEQDRLNEELNKAESGHSEVVYLTKESALAAAEKRFVDLCNKYWQPEPEPEFDYYPDDKQVQNPKDTPSLHLQGGDSLCGATLGGGTSTATSWRAASK